MNSIWNNLYDGFKDRRYGLLFFITFMAILGLLLLGWEVATQANSFDWEPYLPLVFAGLFGLIVVVMYKTFRRSGKSGGRLKYPPLSRDELTKARSKLVKRN